jgi:phage-related protein (TIGR01555 family)
VLNYSLRGIQTNLVGLLEGGDDAMGTIQARAAIIANFAANEGVLILDKEQEAFFQHTTPLTNLEKLLDQARDNMCAVANIPRMVLFGLSPEGMNATAAGELEVFEQYVAGMQETVFRPQLDKIVHMMMLSLWGEIDPEIAYEFAPLREMNAKDVAEIRNLGAQSDSIYQSIGAVGSDEVRKKLAHDPNSGYDNLEVDRVIEPVENAGMNPTGAQTNRPGGSK